MTFWKKAKEAAGVVLKDTCHYIPALYGSGRDGIANPPWVWLHNRNEQLAENPSGPGVRCAWYWGSELHACGVLPALGRRLMSVALSDWPIRLADSPVSQTGPRISFLFAHRGRDRLPQLRHVIRSAFAQRNVRVECVVADLSDQSIGEALPEEVRHLHIGTTHLAPGWYKAWAFNLAARQASGDIFVFQDGDVCMPECYGIEVARTIREDGYEAASIQRFLFYLDETATKCVLQSDSIPPRLTPVRVRQNWKGGTIAVARGAFFALGGFDEGFVDWGGEDDEFYDRCAAKRHCRYGYLPFVHLWHAPQRYRQATDNLNLSEAYPRRVRIAATDRVAELRARGFGAPDGPRPALSYRAQLESKNA